MTNHLPCCQFVVLAYACVTAAPCWGVQYTIQELGSGGAYAINNRGQVVGGMITDPHGPSLPAIWQDGQLTPLSVPGDGTCTPMALNETGAIAGVYFPRDGYKIGVLHRPVFWMNGIRTDVPVYGWGRDVNDSGLGVGDYFKNPDQPEAGQSVFTFDGQAFQEFGPGSACAINNHGQILGYDGVTRGPCVWSAGSVIHLSDLGSEYIWAEDINDAGQVVGFGRTSDGLERACLWNGPSILNLGSLGATASRAHAINNLGQAVGSIWDEGDYRAFVYTDGQMYNLNDLIPPNLGWSLEEAYDINDHGQIIGWGSVNGHYRSFLLTPVPEPAALALTLVGAGLILRRRTPAGRKARL
jgi:probable HAF family extracellular repeat protein